MHLPKVGGKVRPPRILHIVAPLGNTFHYPNDSIRQKDILKELLNFSLDGQDEEIRKSKYRFKK